MRPDPHKKKKNAQYKKKHGIGRDENEREETPTQDNGSSVSNEKQNRRSEDRDNRQKKNAEENKVSKNNAEQNNKDIASGDTEEDSVNQTFPKRKIVSNWNRYGDTPKENTDKIEEREQQLRGADFACLVQQGANAASQFRLQEEKEWDLQGDSDLASNLLSLDCNSVYEKLKTLPLHQRLNIDEKAFDKQSLKVFYEAISSASGNTDKTFFTSFKPQSKNVLKSVENGMDNSVKEEVNIPSEVHKVSSKLLLPENLDDELDSLLNLDISTSSSKISINPVISASKEKREKIVRPPRVSANPKSNTSKNESTDSYDWLDSLLN